MVYDLSSASGKKSNCRVQDDREIGECGHREQENEEFYMKKVIVMC